MMQKACEDAEFKLLVKKLGVGGTARKLGLTKRAVFGRRKRLEAASGEPIENPFLPGGVPKDVAHYPARSFHTIKDGYILAGSDLHIWPGPLSTATRAFIHLIKELQPKLVVLNGDVLDFTRISKYPPSGWKKEPYVQEEIEAAQNILYEIEQACGRGVPKIWPLGNHCKRYETFLATHAPDYAGVHGMKLSDHFPAWHFCWRCDINDDIVIKHRYKGGINAPRNNTLYSGKHTFTGHLHSQNIVGFTDDRGTRYGMDLGCMADVYHSAFIDYTEDNPKDWRAGFGVLKIKGGVLLPPEPVTVWNKNHVAFRGDLIRV